MENSELLLLTNYYDKMVIKSVMKRKWTFMSFVIKLLFFILSIILIVIIVRMVYQAIDKNNIAESFKTKRKNNLFNKQRTSHYYL